MIMAASHQNNVAIAADSSAKAKKGQDDDVCDSWEQIDEGALEKRVQSIKLENSKKNEEENSSRNNPIRIMTNPAMQQQQQQQPIKILKRPPSSKQLNGATPSPANVQPSQPIKTFEQREQEYAQARLRILGSAHPVEEKTNDNQQHDSTTHVGNCNDNSNQSRRNYNNSGNNLNLVRDPIAPDGTRGFNHSNFNNNT